MEDSRTVVSLIVVVGVSSGLKKAVGSMITAGSFLEEDSSVAAGADFVAVSLVLDVLVASGVTSDSACAFTFMAAFSARVIFALASGNTSGSIPSA